jgi:SAM-dependent methyltransferase
MAERLPRRGDPDAASAPVPGDPLADAAQGAIYEAFAPHYDRQGLHRWGRDFAAFTLDTLLPHYGRSPHRALDLACGTGAVALTLAGAGIPTVGLDRSRAMLRLARAKVRAAARACAFVRADLRAFGFARPFDLITCAYDSLNYLLTPHDLRTAFAQVRAALASGGLFVCDLTTARAYAPAPTEGFDLGDVHYGWETAWYPARHRAITTLTVTIRHGDRSETLVERHHQRPYERAEVEAALGAAGLRSLAAFAVGPLLSPTLAPPDAETARIVYVATRA